MPTTLEEFDLALGRSTRRELSKDGVDLSDEAIDEASEESHVESGRSWREFWKLDLQKLARLAACAEKERELGPTAFVTFLEDNIDGVWAFISKSTPSYLRQLVKAGRDLKDEEFHDFLKLLQQLPPV